jgi:hypothetical protein
MIATVVLLLTCFFPKEEEDYLHTISSSFSFEETNSAYKVERRKKLLP